MKIHKSQQSDESHVNPESAATDETPSSGETEQSIGATNPGSMGRSDAESEGDRDLQSAAAERDANYERWMRAEAELENYRKRARKEMDQLRMYQDLPLIRDLLPGLDNLERAISAAAQSQRIEDLLQGVQMVSKQLMDTLFRHSVVTIEAVGKTFDPNLHEAVQQLPSAEHPPMSVMQELERGYQLHDRVIRPTKVIVSSGPAAENSATNKDAEAELEA